MDKDFDSRLGRIFDLPIHDFIKEDIVSILWSGRAPAGLEIFTSLGLAKSNIRSLPDQLRVHGNLDLRQCGRLKRLGERTRVYGNLLIGGSYQEAPNATGEMPVWIDELSDTDDTNLPAAYLKTSTSSFAPIKELPEGMKVDGSVVITNCHNLKELPSSLTIGRNLSIRGCQNFAGLPENLYVSGQLQIMGCPNIRGWPKYLTVEGDLTLNGCSLEEFPSTWRIGRSLRLINCHQLRRLPDPLIIRRGILISGCPIESLPDQFHAATSIRLHRLKNLKTISSHLRASSLTIRKCPQLVSITKNPKLLNPIILRDCKALNFEQGIDKNPACSNQNT